MVDTNFKVSELIASGGMASIYKGVQVSLDRPVAIKRLHPHLTSNVDFVARFEKEAKAVAKLRHENIVSIIDFGQDDEGYYLIMEFVEGKNLKEILTHVKKVPAEIGLVIAEQVALGLRFAHSMNLIHRDIKPANIMLSKNGAVKITDFGIAKAANDITITATGAMIGSPAYMSPEHVRGTDLDNRADIFSLGVVLYEILSGERPFRGENYQEAIASLLTETPKPILQRVPGLSLGFAEIIHHCLEKDKIKRYQNCEDLLLDIKKQMDFYQIQFAPKLVGEFLANPAEVASRLVTNRVQRHLDWGIHYYNEGPEGYKSAKKEFLEVIRWDKDNQTAKKYLHQIEKRANQDPSELRSRVQALKKKAPSILVGLGLLLAIGVGFSAESIYDYFDKSGPSKAANSKTANPGINSPQNTAAKLPTGQMVLYNAEKENQRKWEAKRKGPKYVAPPIEFGTIVVKASPGAIVLINGKESARVPPALTIRAEVGNYRVSLKLESYGGYTKKIEVKKGKTTLVERELEKLPNPSSKKSKQGSF